MKNPDPAIGAKLKSKPHFYKIQLFDSLSRFLRVWLQSFLKSANMTCTIFWLKKSRKVSQNAEFHADFISVEKVCANLHQNKFDEHECKQINAYSVTFLLKIFWCIF
jgi:hypothetical protein